MSVSKVVNAAIVGGACYLGGKYAVKIKSLAPKDPAGFDYRAPAGAVAAAFVALMFVK